MRRVISIGIVFFVLCAGAAPAVGAGGGEAADTPAIGAPAAQTTGGQAPPDPEGDAIGWENGYWYNETIDVRQDDGLSDAELNRYVARSMARVERIRGREFKRNVDVETVPRSEYRNRSDGSKSAARGAAAWNNQVWEGLFIVGEDRNSQAVLKDALGSSVAGFYSPSEDRIKIITDSPERPVIDNATLVHELTHAMQDQYYNLSKPKYSARTQDGELAVDGLVEGEANYVEDRYATHCQRDWQCVRTPSSGGGGGSPPNFGVLYTLLQPYSDGPVFVSDLIDRGGWSEVDRRFGNPPASSEQIIHTTDETPTELRYKGEARNGWSKFEGQGVNGADTVGEASIYAMFWYQAYRYDARTVDVQAFFRGTGSHDMYDYAAAPSDGWGNDKLVPYRKGSGNNATYGYVWVTEWDSEKDARQFRNAYGAILDSHAAESRGNGLYVIPDGPYADAFRVVRNGSRVTIVNGPTPAAVRDLRPSLAASGDGASGGDGSPGGGGNTTDWPVFGVGLALPALAAVAFALLVALALLAVLVRRR